MPLKNKERHREYIRKRYRENAVYRAKHLINVRRNDQKRIAASKALIAEFRSNGCAYCGEMEPACLAAHHKNPKEKEFTIAKAWQKKIGKDRLSRELKKCVCLCHNCHYKLHAGIITL
jgi:hypothetical protein